MKPMSWLLAAVLLASNSFLADVSAQAPKLPPLPELSKLEDLTLLQSQRFHGFVASKVGFNDGGEPSPVYASWFDRKILCGQLDGKAVYLVKVKGERALAEELCFVKIERVALYDEAFGLIAARRWGRRRGRHELHRYRWQDGKLLAWKGASKKEREVATTGRPYMKEGIFLRNKGLQKGKKCVPILDMASGVVREVEFERDRRVATWNGKKVYRFEFNENGVSECAIDVRDGSMMWERCKSAGSSTMGTTDSKEKCAMQLWASMQVTEATTKAALGEWKGKRTVWSNKLLGIKLQLPKKNWTNEKAVSDGHVFLGRGGQGQALFSVSVFAVPPSMGFEQVVDARYESLERIKGRKGASSRNEVKVGKKPGVEITMRREGAGGQDLLDTWRLVPWKGRVLEFAVICHEVELPAWDKDFSTIWKRLKLTK